MTNKEKLEKLKKLADAMYYAAQQLTTDASRLHKAIDEYHKFIIHECKKEPKECMYSKDNYTDKDRKALCDGCEEECEFNKKEEPASEDLEQAIDTYLSTYFGGEKEKQDWPFLKKMAIHFANWQKSKDAKLIINAKDDGYRLGLATMKQQMTAKAVDGDITFDYYGDDDKTYGCIAHDSFCLEDFGLKDRDKVKVIVIKEE